MGSMKGEVKCSNKDLSNWRFKSYFKTSHATNLLATHINKTYKIIFLLNIVKWVTQVSEFLQIK